MNRDKAFPLRGRWICEAEGKQSRMRWRRRSFCLRSSSANRQICLFSCHFHQVKLRFVSKCRRAALPLQVEAFPPMIKSQIDFCGVTVRCLDGGGSLFAPLYNGILFPGKPLTRPWLYAFGRAVLPSAVSYWRRVQCPHPDCFFFRRAEAINWWGSL